MEAKHTDDGLGRVARFFNRVIDGKKFDSNGEPISVSIREEGQEGLEPFETDSVYKCYVECKNGNPNACVNIVHDNPGAVIAFYDTIKDNQDLVGRIVNGHEKEDTVNVYEFLYHTKRFGAPIVDIESLKKPSSDIVNKIIKERPRLALVMGKAEVFPSLDLWEKDLYRKIMDYKLGESQKRGYDIGHEAALQEWNQKWSYIHFVLNSVVPQDLHEKLSVYNEKLIPYKEELAELKAKDIDLWKERRKKIGETLPVHCPIDMHIHFPNDEEPVFVGKILPGSYLGGYEITGGLCKKHSGITRIEDAKNEENLYRQSLVEAVCRKYSGNLN
jgi:hypothetical protein